MAIRKYKPTTPGRRGSSVADFAEITRSTPEKSLLRPLSKTGGRNNQGRITTRHIGGGHKRQYRVIDFRRNDKDGVNAKVAHIEYDPNRTANIALLHFLDGEKRYILAPQGLKQGDVIESGANADIKPGNNLPMRNIPAGTLIHAVELRPGGGAKLARSAGVSIQLLGMEGAYATLRMPSGEIRRVDVRWRAINGQTRFSDLASGEIDVDCSNTTNTRERRETRHVAFSMPYYMAGVRILTLSSSKINDADGLHGKRVITTKGL